MEMPSRLIEISNVCERLTKGTATERKKAAEKLKALLTTDGLNQLDRSTASPDAGICQASWRTLFEVSEHAMIQEIRGQKNKQGKPTLYELIKFILQKGVDRKLPDGSHALPTSQILEHISLIVSDYGHFLASEYAQILVNSFLSLRTRLCGADRNLLRKILVKYMKGAARGDSGYCSVICGCVISTLMDVVCRNIDIRPAPFIKIYDAVFSDIRQHKNVQFLQCIVQSCNAMIEATAANHRKELASFTDQISSKLLHVWENKPSNQLKLELVHHFNLQVVMHEADDFKDDSPWEKVVWKLYEILYQEVVRFQTPSRGASSAQGVKFPLMWTDSFFTLLVSVCNLVVPQGYKVYEVAQSITQTQFGPSQKMAKKRRVESGWQAITLSAFESNNDHMQGAWLRVMSQLLMRNRTLISEEEMTSLLVQLVSLLSRCKKPHLFPRIEEVLYSISLQDDFKSVDNKRVPYWRKVVAHTIHLAERNHSCFYRLLRRLMEQGFIKEKSNIVRLIRASCESGVACGYSFLRTVLQLHELHHFSLLSDLEMEIENVDTHSEYWQHVYIAERLLQHTDDEEGITTFDFLSGTQNAVGVGEVLASMMVIDPPVKSECRDEPLDIYHSISQSYKLMSFDKSSFNHLDETLSNKRCLSAAATNKSNAISMEVFTKLINGTIEDAVNIMKEQINRAPDKQVVKTACHLMISLSTLGSSLPVNQEKITPLILLIFTLAKALLSKCETRPELLRCVVQIISPLLASSSLEFQALIIEVLTTVETEFMSACQRTVEKLIQNQSSAGQRDSVDSASSAGFDDDDDFARPETPNDISLSQDSISSVSAESSSVSSNVYETSYTEDEVYIKDILQILALCGRPTDSTYRLPTLQLLKPFHTTTHINHALILIDTLRLASQWEELKPKLHLTLLIYAKNVMERFFGDSVIGQLCLTIIQLCTRSMQQSHLINEDHIKDNGAKIIVIINVMLGKIYQKTGNDEDSFDLFPLVNSSYRLSFIDCMYTLFQADSLLQWKTTASVSVSEIADLHYDHLIVKMMFDTDFTVQQRAISQLPLLVKRAGNKLATREVQVNLYEMIHKELQHFKCIEDEILNEERIDSVTCKTATILRLYKELILSSPATRHMSVYDLLVISRDGNLRISCDQIIRVLSQIVPDLGFPSVTSFCEFYLPYVGQRWLSAGRSLNSIPYELFSCTSITQFHRRHSAVFLPLIPPDNLTSMYKPLLACDITDYLLTNLPTLILHTIPHIAAGVKNDAARLAKLRFEWVDERIKQMRLETAAKLNECLPEVVHKLYASIWDPQTDFQSEPEPPPPCYSSNLVTKSLTFIHDLMSRANVPGSSLLEMLSISPGHLTRLHYLLANDMLKNCNSSQSRSSVECYSTFINHLANEMGSNVTGHAYHLFYSITRITIEILTNLLSGKPSSEDKETVSHLCITLLNSWKELLLKSINTCAAPTLVDPSIIMGKAVKALGCIENLPAGVKSTLDRLHSTITESRAQLPYDASMTAFVSPALSNLGDFLETTRSLEQNVKALIYVSKELVISLDFALSYLLNVRTKLYCMDVSQFAQLIEDRPPYLVKLVQYLVTELSVLSKESRFEAQRILVMFEPAVIRECLASRNSDDEANDELKRLCEDLGTSNILMRDLRILQKIVHYLLLDSDSDLLLLCDSTLKQLVELSSCDEALQLLQNYKEDNYRSPHLLSVLTPYISSEKKRVRAINSHEEVVKRELWTVGCKTYSDWLTNLSSTLCESCPSELLRVLAPLCKLKVEFCELILPYQIADLLSLGNQSLQSRLSGLISNLLDKCMNDNSDTTCSEILKLLLKIVEYLRSQPNVHYNVAKSRGSRTAQLAWNNNFWLDISYRKLAKVAMGVKDYLASVMYAEIHLTQNEVGHLEFQSLMLENYKQLGDTDSAVGWGLEELRDSATRLSHYTHDKQWSKALVTLNQHTATSGTNTGIDDGSMKLLELNGLKGMYTGLMYTRSHDDVELRYRQAWTNAQWDELPPYTRITDSVGLNQTVYSSLRSLTVSKRPCDPTQYLQRLDQLGLMTIVSEPYKAMTILKTQQFIKDIYQLQFGQDAASDIVRSWQRSVLHISEPADLLTSSDLLDLTSAAVRPGSDPRVCELVRNCHLKLSEKSRNVMNCVQMSECIMKRLEERHSYLWTADCDLEQSRIFYKLGDVPRALHILQTSCLNSQLVGSGDSSNLRTQCEALRLAGEWMSEQKTVSADEITRKYLRPSTELANRTKNNRELEAAHYALASFSDSEYERIKTEMKSEEFKQKLQLLKTAQATYNIQIQDADFKRKNSAFLKNLSVSESSLNREVTAAEKSYLENMVTSLTSYLHCLKSGSQFDLMCAFRVVAIWLENEDKIQVQELIKNWIPGSISSAKFIPLLCQLSARLSAKSDINQQCIRNLLKEAALKHPHHTLPVLLALTAAVTDLGPNHTVDHDTEARAVSSSQILNMVSSHESKAKLVSQYQLITDQLISLANQDPKSLRVTMTAKDLECVPVLTLDIKVDPTGDYKDLPYIRGYDKKFSLCGGINVPKVVHCIGSDGHKYKQLCKGKDDARQDAMMEQVFTLVNEMMMNKAHQDPAYKPLLMRTYKIIPLSRQSGILQWCNGTMPLGFWLKDEDNGGAHCRYQADMTVDKMKESVAKMKALSKNPASQRLKIYQEITKKLQPVMRYFFFEKYSNPGTWYQNRLNFTRTAAVSSMIGYILGIGDRHTSNILIDTATAELVHIDFGYTFDVGLSLYIPEIVPFRLTRDMVDGMGPMGVKGTYTKCCERTLSLMADNKKIIMTILQVLIDDPLLNWVLSEDKLAKSQLADSTNGDSPIIIDAPPTPARKRQKLSKTGINTSVNQASSSTLPDAVADSKHQRAEAALIRIDNRLTGQVVNGRLAPAGHVNYLIQQASAPENLSLMFVGWAPFL